MAFEPYQCRPARFTGNLIYFGGAYDRITQCAAARTGRLDLDLSGNRLAALRAFHIPGNDERQ